MEIMSVQKCSSFSNAASPLTEIHPTLRPFREDGRTAAWSKFIKHHLGERRFTTLPRQKGEK